VELCLDVLDLGQPGAVLLGLEAELLPGGDLALLTTLAATFENEWRLVPEPRAKFWQAVAVLRPDLLPPDELEEDVS
jgi:hypothetical protein